MEREFLHYVANVTLHRIGGDSQSNGDLLVALSFRDQGDYLAFTLRHMDSVNDFFGTPLYRALSYLREKRSSHARWKHTLSRCNSADGSDKILERCILQNETGYADIHELGDFFMDGKKIHDDDFAASDLVANTSRYFETVRIEQADVEKNYARFCLFQHVRLETRAGEHDGQVRKTVDHLGHSFTDEAVVLDDRHGDCIRLGPIAI